MCKEYYIKIDGQRVSVTEEVYRAYKRPEWRELRQRQRNAGMRFSLDMIIEAGFEIADDSDLIVEVVEEKELLDMLNKALDELDDDERFLITELFYNNKSEEILSSEIGIPQTTINYRKRKTLQRLKQLLGN